MFNVHKNIISCQCKVVSAIYTCLHVLMTEIVFFSTQKEMRVEFSALPRHSTYIRKSHVFSVENALKCLVHLLFMQNGAAERSVLVICLYLIMYLTP